MISTILSSGGPEATQSDHRLSDNVALIALDDGTGRLFDLRGASYALSRSATAMLSHTLKAGSGTAADHVAAEFATTRDRVAHDQAQFLADLKAKGIIFDLLRDDNQGHPSRSRLLSCMLSLALRRHGPVEQARSLMSVAYIATRFYGWVESIATWQDVTNSRTQVSRAKRAITCGDVELAVREAAAGHYLDVRCKEQALACWAMLRYAGQRASLRVGVDIFPFSSHCWVETSEGTIVGDDLERCVRYVSVFSYC